MTGTPSSLWFAFAFIGLAMNLPASAQAQAIRGELLAVDAVRARKALDNHLGAEKAAGYARVKSGCEFPPCTDVQKRFAVFESVIEAAPSVSRRRQLTCIGERGLPWTCTRHRVIVTLPGRSRDIELSETLSDTKALAALEFLDSECFAPQRATLNAKREHPAATNLAEQVFSMEERGQTIRLSLTMRGSRWHYVDLQPSPPGSSCPFEAVMLGTAIL